MPTAHTAATKTSGNSGELWTVPVVDQTNEPPRECCRTVPVIERMYVNGTDYEFFVCGPPAFMQSVYDGLRTFNIADNRIHAEAFGPASLRWFVD